MHARHDLHEQFAERLRRAAPKRSDVSLAAEQACAARCSAGTFSMELAAGHEHHASVPVLVVRGEIDLATAPAVRAALLPLLEHQTGPVVADLSEVGFIDSSGVHVLVETLKRLNLENRRFAIACREQGQVHRVLGLVGLLDAMAVCRSRERAMACVDDPSTRDWQGPPAERIAGADKAPTFVPAR